MYLFVYLCTHLCVFLSVGDPGCGKSCRVPAMLYQDAMERGVRCRIMISQPRQLIASSLTRRLRSQLGHDKVGTKRSDGLSDDTDHTVIHFVTVNYLVRLIADHPESFADHTHLILDEIHDRSVESDVLCLLVRRLLSTHPRLRLVLMSATAHAAMYQDYFATDMSVNYGSMEPLHTGLSRFPLNIRYLNDLAISSTPSTTTTTKKMEKFPSLVTQLAAKLLQNIRSSCGDLSLGPGATASATSEMNVLHSNLMGMSVSGRSVSTLGDGERVKVSEEVPSHVIKDQHALTVGYTKNCHFPYTKNYPYQPSATTTLNDHTKQPNHLLIFSFRCFVVSLIFFMYIVGWTDSCDWCSTTFGNQYCGVCRRNW